MEPVQPFSAKEYLDPHLYKIYKRNYEIDFKDDAWDIRATIDKPRIYIIAIMAVVGIMQLAAHRTFFGTISLICAFLAVFAYQAGIKRYTMLNTGIEKLTITPEGITEYLQDQNSTHQYYTNQIQSIYTTSIPHGNKHLISVIMRDIYGSEHAMITFLSKDANDQQMLAGNLATAIKTYIGFDGI